MAWQECEDNTVFSYIGMIIQSTTLDTEAKVKEVYGGTTWIAHSGYVLRGASSGVTANDAQKTGGADTHTLTTQEIPAHNHSVTAYYTTAQGGNGIMGSNATGTGISRSVNNTGGGKAHNNLPSYKSVYIWERTA